MPDCRWQGISLFERASWYNLCCPLPPREQAGTPGGGGTAPSDAPAAVHSDDMPGGGITVEAAGFGGITVEADGVAGDGICVVGGGFGN